MNSKLEKNRFKNLFNRAAEIAGVTGFDFSCFATNWFIIITYSGYFLEML